MSRNNSRLVKLVFEQSSKLILGAIFLLVILMILAACGDTATSAVTTSTTLVATATTAATTSQATTTVATTTAATTSAAATTTQATTVATTAATTQATTTVSATTQAATSTSAATTSSATTTQAGATTTEPTPPNLPGDAAQGKIVFMANCTGCHPNGGTEAGYGPNLSTSAHAIDPAYVTHNVRLGRGFMPPFTKDQVSDQDLANIIAYLKSIHKS